jgi:hypothetical protein
VVDSLKALDPKRPIREADIHSARPWRPSYFNFPPIKKGRAATEHAL